MVEDITIRMMTQNDRPAILSIDAVIVGEYRAASWQQKVDRYLEISYPALCHVAETKGTVIGFILGDIRGWEYGLPLAGWIDVIGIIPEYQARGIGRKLVEAFTSRCQALGINSVHAIIQEGDEPIQAFLRSLGYRRGQLIDFVKTE